MLFPLVVAAFAVSGVAHAACVVSQEGSPKGVTLHVDVVEEPVHCRTLTVLTTGAAPKLRGTLTDEYGRNHRLPRDHFFVVPGGVEVGIPELKVGGKVVIDVELPGSEVTVAVGAPPPRTPAAETHEIRTFLLDMKHPGWGFADAKLSETRVEVHRINPDGVAQSAHPGVDAQGIVELSPGSFTIIAPAVQIYPWGSEGVVVSRVKDGVRWDAPEGGEARWRVGSVGPDAVIPDGKTFVSGVDWRFTQVSLPEPAVPVRLHGKADKGELAREILMEVRALTDARLPGKEALRPRPLNRAWNSGWATSVERGLILHRMLGQERINAGWALTGENPEFLTLTGYDAMLVVANVDDADRILDPGCKVCGWGEFSTKWAGKPAVGILERIPRAPGEMKETVTLTGETFHAKYEAAAAAALWLREAVADVEAARAKEVLARTLGMPGATVVSVAGLADIGKPVTVELTGITPPKHPFEEGAEPWEGGWSDL